MEEYLTPKSAQLARLYAKAREILDGMSRYRIDPRTIETINGGRNAKGGQGTVVIGTVMPPEEMYTWTPEPLPKELVDIIYARKEYKRDCEEADKGLKSSKSLLERLCAGSIADLPDPENFPTWYRDKVVEELLGAKYAIKKLEWYHKDAEESVKFFKSFVNELSLMAELSHPNIIELVGFVEDIEKYDAWIVLPWEANGNVREFLQSGEWDIPERISLIQDVVNGVGYLHTREPPICHGDLKSLNILVSSYNHAVITDFGSARSTSNADAKDHTTSEELPQAANDDPVQELTTPKIEFNRSTLELTLTGPLFTLRWAAPEVLAADAKGLPSDMWAVGWICWEIITGKIPFEELSQDASVVAWVVTGKLPAIREEAQLSLVLKLCALMSDCWKRDPSERIGAADFQRRVNMMPSIAPSDCAAGGSKIRSAELLLELGQMYRLQDNIAMAKAHIDSALNIASQTNNHSAGAHALDCLGQIYHSQGRNQEAEKAFREAHEIHARIGNDLGAANALCGLGDIYRVQWRSREAVKVLREAHKIYARIGDDLGAGNALHALGEIYRTQSRNQAAEKTFREAQDIHARIGNDIGAANALHGLGQIYGAQSRKQEAEKALREAQDMFARIGNDLGAAKVLHSLGEIYRTQSRNQEAEKALREAHGIRARIGSFVGVADALHSLGEIYRTQSRNQEAEKALREAHEIYARIGDDVGAANALLGLGHICRVQSKNQEAEKALREAHATHARIGNDLGVANALLGLGEIYRAQSRNQEAEKALRGAHATSSRVGDLLGTGNSLYSLGLLFSQRYRHEEAQSLLCDALVAYNRAGSSFSRAYTLLPLARVYQMRGNHLQAEESVTEALTIGIQLQDDRLQAGASDFLAIMFSNHSKYSTTLAAPLQAGPACEPLVADIRRAAALHDLGKTSLTQSNYSEAAEFYLQARDIFSRIGDGHGEASIFRSLGTLLTVQGRFQLAMKHFAQARRISAGISDHNGEVRALGCLMGACLQQPTLAGLRSYCVDALKIYGRTQWSTDTEASASSMSQADLHMHQAPTVSQRVPFLPLLVEA